MSKTINLFAFSGGKDSTALLLWGIENIINFIPIFCDTGWEHPLTYNYVEYIDKTILGGGLKVLKSKKYDGFEDMVYKKKRVPSTMARFCTEQLKIVPTKEFIDGLRNEYETINLYLGIRADESFARSKLTTLNFDDTYYKCWIHRPLLKWSAEAVFEIHKRHNIEPNPLYKMGMKRVGCMPCIMAGHKEVMNIIKYLPDAIEKVRSIEKNLGRTFFPPGYIPDWACSGFDEKTGKKFPTVEDVVKYLQDNPDQVSIFEEEPHQCLSYYSICE